MKLKSRKDRRRRRHLRVRKRISGTGERPRMSLAVSGRHLYVQFVDDERQVTLAAASTLKEAAAVNVDTARRLGQKAGREALGRGIRRVVVDRGGFRFCGRIRALVEGAAQAGLEIGSVAAQGASPSTPDKEEQ